MNKVIIEKNETLENLGNEELTIIIRDDAVVNLINNNYKKMNIMLENNKKVLINEFSLNTNHKTEINLIATNNSHIIYNLSNIISDNDSLKVNLNYIGSNNILETNISSLVKNTYEIKVVGKIKNNQTNNELLENIKVLLLDSGNAKVIPDMLIDTNLMAANHKASISGYDKKELFYLMSKGLSEKSSKELLKQSFLLRNFKDKKLIEKLKKQI